jgi:hypothetical protein
MGAVQVVPLIWSAGSHTAKVDWEAVVHLAETLSKLKKTLGTDWDPRYPTKKWKNVSQIRNREKRHKEIKSPPGCQTSCIPCHQERTYPKSHSLPSTRKRSIDGKSNKHK